MRARLNVTAHTASTLLAAGLYAVAAQAVPVSGQGTWETTLLARDLDGDKVADAYYDTALHITWLADSNYAVSSGFGPSLGGPLSRAGYLNWFTADTWSRSVSIDGITGWRLPRTSGSGAGACDSWLAIGFPVCSYTADPGLSELSHLNTITLGNSASGGLTNTGPFSNLHDFPGYYSGSQLITPHRTYQYVYGMGNNSDTLFTEISVEGGLAWLVHDGDIAAVPEPGSLALILGGMALIAGRRRQRHG